MGIYGEMGCTFDDMIQAESENDQMWERGEFRGASPPHGTSPRI